MPSITGRVEVNLTVRDPQRSAEWYRTVLGLQQRYDFTSDDGRLRYISLIEPENIQLEFFWRARPATQG